MEKTEALMTVEVREDKSTGSRQIVMTGGKLPGDADEQWFLSPDDAGKLAEALLAAADEKTPIGSSDSFALSRILRGTAF